MTHLLPLRALLLLSLLLSLLLAAPTAALAAPPLDASLHGVALDDLLDHGDLPAGAQRDLVARAAELLDSRKALGLRGVFSRSVVALDDDAITVDVVGRHPRFTDADPDIWRGAVGVVTVRLRSDADADALETISERALGDLTLHVQLSLADQLIVVESDDLTFRRSYPAGVGAIDRVRRPGEATSLTPTVDFGRLDRANARRHQDVPAHFRSEPYIPLNVRHSYERNGEPYSVWRRSRIGFHIWQAPRFRRGYFSHGCVRMRTADLRELYALVNGSHTPLSTTIMAPPFDDVAHPYPQDTKIFDELKNYGTADRPAYKVIGGMFRTIAGKGVVPPARSIVGIAMGDERQGTGAHESVATR